MSTQKKYNTDEERKEANKIAAKKWRDNNLEKAKAIDKETYLKNKEKIKIRKAKKYLENHDGNTARNKKWREENKDKIKENRVNNKEKDKIYREVNKEKIKNYREANKEKRKIYNQSYKKNRFENDILFNLSHKIRASISKSFRDREFRKKCRTIDILGCSFDELKQHLENQFEDWMNWDNKGNPKDGIFELNKTWDIDHIEPISNAKDEADIIRLNHYTNLRPLCSYINRWVKRNY